MTQTLSNFRRSSAAVLTLAACLIAGTSYAASPAAAPSVSVRYGDLDLSTDQGVNKLYARVAAAARHVCADGLDIRDLAAYAAERACETHAIDSAVQQVQAPKVAARLAARHEG